MTREIINQLSERLQQDPYDPMLLLNLSAQLRRANDVESSSDLLLRCSRVYKDQGELDRAIACLHQLLRFDPNNTNAITRLRRLSRMVEDCHTSD